LPASLGVFSLDNSSHSLLSSLTALVRRDFLCPAVKTTKLIGTASGSFIHWYPSIVFAKFLSIAYGALCLNMSLNASIG
jgi:hypothetical protein